MHVCGYVLASRGGVIDGSDLDLRRRRKGTITWSLDRSTLHQIGERIVVIRRGTLGFLEVIIRLDNHLGYGREKILLFGLLMRDLPFKQEPLVFGLKLFRPPIGYGKLW